MKSMTLRSNRVLNSLLAIVLVSTAILPNPTLALSPLYPSPLWNPDRDDIIWNGPSKVWEYYSDANKLNGYSVKRYEFAGLSLTHTVDDGGLQSLGIMPLVNGSELFLYYADMQRLVRTGYFVPTTGFCDRCGRSNPQVGTVQVKDGKILVASNATMQADWFLLDPFYMTTDTWIDYTEFKLMTGETILAPRVVNNQITIMNPSNALYTSKYWVSRPNVFEPNTSFTQKAISNLSAVTVPPAFPYLLPTDKLSGYTIGQIDKGVYISNGKQLTKVGFAKTEPALKNGVTSNGELKPMYHSLYNPRAVSSNSFGWIGQDGAFYTAVINGILPNTGLHDVPQNVPFRSASDSTVYYYSDISLNINDDTMKVYVVQNEKDYKELFNDPKFLKVMVLPDHAVNSQALHARHHELSASFPGTTVDDDGFPISVRGRLLRLRHGGQL